ncbi:hypothetical protein [Corallococcus sp. 4LFB]|uniref:hypothetical protein n=1 Tax=Corallococcus sp. 4LFB TaxID=3383249 RepID=UPI003974BEC8
MGRPGWLGNELLGAYLLPSGHVAAYSVPLVRVLFVLADIDAEVALHEQRERISSAFVIVELPPGRRVDAVKPLRDVDQRFANGHVMQPARVEHRKDGFNQTRVVCRHHPQVEGEIRADDMHVGGGNCVAEKVPGLRLVEQPLASRFARRHAAAHKRGRDQARALAMGLSVKRPHLQISSPIFIVFTLDSPHWAVGGMGVALS